MRAGDALSPHSTFPQTQNAHYAAPGGDDDEKTDEEKEARDNGRRRDR
jgi:hypothetical protein